METTGQKPSQDRWLIAPRWMRIRLRTLVAIVTLAALVMAAFIDLDNRKHRDHHARTEMDLCRGVVELEKEISVKPVPSVDFENMRTDSFEILYSCFKDRDKVILKYCRRQADREAALKTYYQRRLLWPF